MSPVDKTEEERLDDLVAFAALEIAGADVEPWAEVIGHLYRAGEVDVETALWLVKGYNAYDDLGAAWKVYRRWPTPLAWYLADDRDDAADASLYPIAQERRSLRGGRILRHLDAYVARLGGQSQRGWIASVLPSSGDPAEGFARLTPHLRTVYGVGRQTAFEWAEFAAKVAGLPVDTSDALLWESTGPRRAIERFYLRPGDPPPTGEWLNARAAETKARIEAAGVELSWWDFETIVCDYNVMRDGRYYPGQHLAMIREEADAQEDPADRALLHDVLDAVTPEGWRSIPGGIDYDLRKHYRDTGEIAVPAPVERTL